MAPEDAADVIESTAAATEGGAGAAGAASDVGVYLKARGGRRGASCGGS